ncbi:MAG: M23 family metallopeptidase [Gemmatimonadales bacterium]|nr:MAG: M23 family metallopeptidase [Gemmatimonadales bacterium]
MSQEHWTLLLIRGDRENVRQISLPARRLRFALAGASALILLLVVAAVSVGMQARDGVAQHLLERQNRVLAAELELMRTRVSDLRGELNSLVEKDSEIRLVAGLDPIDAEVQRVGIGGPGSPDLRSHPLYELDEDAASDAFALTYDLHALERRARLLRESLSEAGEELVNHRALLKSTPSILPTAGAITSGFSHSRMHPIHHEARPHTGIDISAPTGTPILAAAQGRVTFAGRRAGYGLTVIVDHGFGYSTLYAHASEVKVRAGQEVSRGDVIARVGRSGIATSPHLHYEVHVGGRPVDPRNYLLTEVVP